MPLQATTALPSYTKIIIDPNPGSIPVEKLMADLNGDGKLDIIVGLEQAGLYWWAFPSSGKVTDPWSKHTIKSTGSFYEDLQPFDLNGDGRVDIIACHDNNMYWYQNPGGGATGAWTEHFIGNGLGHEVELADIDGDGKIDVVTQFGIYFQNNPDSWTYRGLGSLKGLALLDIGSGKGAINLVLNTSAGLTWYENPREWGGAARTSGWNAHLIDASTGSEEQPIGAGRLTSDGRMSLVGNPPGQGLVWWQAPVDRRSGAWVKRMINSSYQAIHKIVAVDMDNNGTLDLVVGEQEQSHDPAGGPYTFNNDRVTVFYNNGSGGFTEQVLETTGGQNNVAMDVDGDGDKDILNVNHGFYGAPHPIELFINNLNSGAPPPPPPPPPWGGTPAILPGTFQAENFDQGGEGVAYHDLESQNLGGQYRTGEGVDIGTSSASGSGGFAVGWCRAGEWIEYTVNVTAAGTYTLSVPVALPFQGGTFHLEFNGVDKTGALSVPNTGGADTWQTVTKSGLSLSAGVQVLRVVMDTNGPAGWVTNLDRFTFTASGGAGGVIGNGTGLRGDYFDNSDFTAQKLTRTDATVNFDWGSGGPDPSVAPDSFSVRWTGQVQAQFSETYAFFTVSDDGVRLWVNGVLVVNNWTDHAPTENSGTIGLTAGQRVDLKMEFYENGGGAVAKLLWSSPSTAKQTVPQSQLYPAASGGSSPPPPPPSENLAKNPGFESDPNVDYFPYGSATFSWATDAAHGDSHSVKVVSVQPAGTLTRWLSKTTSIPAQAGATYKASAWFKTSGVSDHAGITINFWDANSVHLGSTDGNTLSGTANWTLLSTQAVAPAGTVNVRVEFRLWGPGSMWADDVTLTKN